MNAKTHFRGAAIGGGYYDEAGTIRIYGGTVTAEGSDAGAIGNGLEGDSDGSIEIYGGTVTAKSNNFSAAIGGADGTDGPAVTISGGTVKATNVHGPGSGAAIGSGRGANRTNPIRITGGTVTALSTDSAAIGAGCEASASNIDLSGGVIVATAFGGGAGIGGGAKGNADSVTISGATVNASSCAYLSSSDFVNAIDKWIGTISYYSPGGNVDLDAIRGQALVALSLYFIQSLSIVLSDAESGCGIGAGYKGTFSNITISNHSDVTANSGKYAAAIGSGDENVNGGGTITITDSVVKATAGTDAAAIGTGNECDSACDAINITNSTVTANGGRYAAGIGGGDAVSGGTINITNSTITEAKSETDGAGIGGGESGNGGTINITGSAVTAHGGGYAAGIGGGDDGDGGTITIDHSTVKAYGGTDAAGIGGGEDGDGGYITIKNHSDVYAEGNEYGAGIGGGEDAGVQKVHIDYTSKAVAYAGGDGNSVAIGHGDYNKTAAAFSGNYPSNGTLKLSPQHHIVEAGSSPNSTTTYRNGDIWNACRKNKYAFVHPCLHTDTYVKILNDKEHATYCKICGEQIGYSEKHTWGSDNKCTVCGAQTEPIECTFIERNNSGEVTKTVTLLKRSSWVAPYPENTPDGTRFSYWETDYDGDIVKYMPGEHNGLSHALTFRAVYIPIIQTTYIDENGEQQDVDAVRLTKANIEDNKLDCDWYLIDSESDIDADYTIWTTKSLNIILADGTYKYCKNITAVEDLNIYGQAKQTGTLDISASNGTISPDNYTQYGGVVKAYMIRADYNCEFKGGILETKSQFKGMQSTKLSWTRFSKDQVKINGILTSSPVPIADGFGFTDGENTYTGSIPYTAQGKTLTPAALRNYSSTPTWTWSDDHSEAFATFKCTDAGHEDETVSVAGNITHKDYEDEIKYTATCLFKGKGYSNTVHDILRYRVYTSKTGEGTLSVSGDTYMSPGEKITVTATPASGYKLKSLTVNPYPYDENIKISLKGDNTFKMPESAVDVIAVFIKAVSEKEPYIDDSGEYHPGNVAYYEIDGKYYAMNKNGSVGDELNEVAISYFDFALLSDNTYQIRCYTGPMDNLSQLEIPKTFNGKAITVIGDEEQSFMKGTGTQRAFSLVLNENVTTIKGLAFFWSMLTEVKGDTSGLNQIKDTPFVWANISNENKLTLKLDYPGRIIVDSNALNYENITARIKHATTLSSDGKASSIEYIFTDAHTYGEPVWTWADDYSSATATFTCADSRCKHEETVSATVTSAESEDNTIYIATAEFDGETYTDVKGSYYIRILGSEHGTVTADKTHADEGETVTLTATPDDKYMLKSVTVKDADNNAVTVTNNSFTMPAGGVTVSAVFGIRPANISVGGVGINVNNCSDILGDGTASYDFDTNTLTLTNANIEVKNGNGIRYNEKSGMPFNIVLNGENRIADDTDDGSRTCYGIALYAAAPGFKISGSGTLDIEMNSANPRIGIHARKALTVEGAKVNIDVTGSENAIGVDLVYGDSVLKLDNAARVEINTGGYAMQSNRNVKNLNVGDDCFFEAISDKQAVNSNINLTDDHPAVIVNTEPSADGAENWNVYTALASYKYINIRGEDAPYWVAIIQPEHGTVTADKLSANEGESVTLTATPDDGYILNAYSVKDSNGETVAVTDNSFVMPASDVTVTATFTKNKFTVTWKNGDTVLETDEHVPYGATPTYDGETPAKAATAQYTYTFNGWSPELSKVTGDVTYTAVFTETVNRYTVKWKNGDTVIETDENVPYGTTPTYDGETPTKAGTAQHSYTFTGWSPEISEVTGDITYTALFDEAVNKYTVTWENGDTVLETDEDVPYGTIPTYDGETPTKASDDENHAYIFSGWSPEISAATGDVTYTAQFAQATRIAETQPYIDENGAYILGLKAHYETDSKFYSVNNDGTIGEEVTEESLKLSYFDFTLINNDTEYQINYYTGPTETLTKLEIPKTFNGKNITVLGNDNKDRLYEGTKTQFELVLNENIREIKGYTFYVLYVTKVSGDTSGLSIIGDYAFSWANSPDGYTLDIQLDYIGKITTGASIFNHMNVTARIRHATTFNKSNFGQQSISYVFTDAHTYGEPEWTWADDYSSATAKFTCTDSRCKHEETVDAMVTSVTKDGVITYTATAALDGKTCTDTKTAYSDGVGARLLGHSISLDGDIAVNFYMELAPEIAQSKTAYMQFTVPNTSTEYRDQKVYVEDLTPIEGGYYVFKCRVAAKDMNSEITAQIQGVDKESTPYTYSVKEYADYLIEHKNDNAAYAKAAPLVEKMLQYGAYAKAYFDNATLDDLGEVEIDNSFATYESTLTEDIFSGATLSLKSQTSLSLYFTSEDDLTFSCVDKEGNECVVDTAKNGSYQVARIRNIAAKELQDNFTLTVKSGETVLGTITYSPMNYCYKALSGGTTDAKLINAVKALVQYSQEANEYFK